MKLRTAVITAAGRSQRSLSLQRLVDRDGRSKSVLEALCREALTKGIERVVVVVAPGDAESFREGVQSVGEPVHFVEQPEPSGYADALVRGLVDVGSDEGVLHLVGDHLIVADRSGGVAEMLIEAAQRESSSVSAVRPTREHSITRFGVVGGEPVTGWTGLYEVRRVIEKPTPTVAEQELLVPGLRAGHYLGFFGTHVLSPGVLERLRAHVEAGGRGLSEVLDESSRSERVLALEVPGRRFDLGDRYGLFAAQLAVGLEGVDRETVLDTVARVLLQRERRRGGDEGGDE